MKISELNAARRRQQAEAAGGAGQRETDVVSAGHIQTAEEVSGADQGRPQRDIQERREMAGACALPYDTQASLRLQYEYELERSREISSSITRLTLLIPMMIACVCLMDWAAMTFCAERIGRRIFLRLGIADVIVLLCALIVACTVHFYILNPAPGQAGEDEWLGRMMRELQRGNNWRAWLVFAATVLIYIAAGITLAILILGLVGM